MRKRALVVGGSGGVGAAICEVLRSQFRVESWARSSSATTDSSVVRMTVDVMDPVQVSERLAHIDHPFDVLVYAAGVAKWGSVGTQPLTEWEEMLGANVTGFFNVLGSFRRRWASFPKHTVVIGSEASEFPKGGRSGYHASKAALAAFTESLRLEANAEDAAVTIVVPGRIASNFVVREMGVPSLRPEDVARAVLFAIDQPDGCQVARIDLYNPAGPFKRR